jgi:hypothetical protein
MPNKISSDVTCMIFSMNEIVCAFPSLYLSEPSSLTVTACQMYP